MEFTSIEICGKCLDLKENLYKNVDGPFSILATVTQGFEAIVELWVSVMKNHLTSKRGLTDSRE